MIDSIIAGQIIQPKAKNKITARNSFLDVGKRNEFLLNNFIADSFLSNYFLNASTTFAGDIGNTSILTPTA